MTGTIWPIALLVLATIPLAMGAVNLLCFRRLRRPAEDDPAKLPTVSVLIPARNEEPGIEAAVRAVLANRGVNFELVVLDDQSEDGTAAVVRRIAAADPRVTLERGSGPPAGWCGKQYACYRLSKRARHDLLVWIDADVRLAPDALARIAARMADRRVALLSGFPRQTTVTWMEQLVVPLIPFLLLGYLPMPMSRLTRLPGFATGCGQLFAAWREPYESIGGHGAVRGSMHDGVKLPPAFRRAGHMTDIFDASDLADCRMYRHAGEVWAGFAKNATEGLATPIGLPVWTLLLVGGHVAPWLALVGWLSGGLALSGSALAAVGAAALSSLLFSATIAGRMGQPPLAWLGRPVGVAILLAIQWSAFVNRLLGRPATWKGRPQAAPSPR